MSVSPLRANTPDDDPRERLDAQLQDLDRRLQELLEASTNRIHDFERRLEHEWLALRELHEEQLKTLRARVEPEPAAFPREASLEGISPAIARRAPVIAIVAVAALAALAVFTAQTRWRLGADVRALTARHAAAEGRITELQALVEQQTRETQQTVQRLTADALTSSARAERLANVLAASDVQVYPMRGLRAAAGASGQVLFSATRGIALTGSRLPLTPSGQVYQVWMTTTRGPISLGFATPDGQGRVEGAYEAPPELLGTVIGFMLSTEPTGGNTRPTGAIAIAS